MDLRLQANPQLHYGINGAAGRNSRQHEDDLRFLSQEEQECIQFFEETIDSLEESLEENDPRLEQRISRSLVEGVNGPPTSSPNPGVTVPSFLAGPPSPKDQDIIDLVRPEPDLVQNKERNFSPTNPDFQSMVPTPESHFEIKPRRDQTDSLPSEYNPPLPSGSYGPTDSHSSYHPPGCIPTPVLIAQKIAENQAGGTSNFLPSSHLRPSSLDSEKPLSYSTDGPIVKYGPPTSAKPNRYPSNINVILGNKEHQNQSLANVNLHERRAQMLANLSGSHPLLQEEPQPSMEQKARNVPTRSISFKDPSPDKSRMEALSKLGLNRNRAMSGGLSLLVPPNSTSLDPSTGAETNAKPLEASVPPTTKTNSKLPEAIVRSPSQIYEDRKAEILRTDSLRSNEDRNRQLSPSPPAVTQGSFYPPPPLDTKTSIPPAPEVTSLEFNSYGGKSIVVNPSVSSKSEPPTSQTSHEPKILPPVLANPSEFNPYGGKTKVMTPAAVTRSDLPDILSSHIDKSQTFPAKSEPLPTELNSYGGKSRTINPSTGLNRPSRSLKPPAPTPAQKPPRHSYHGAVSSQKAALRALSPEHKRRPGSMFRPQGITVQFSGRGAMDESRRDALRKLGLLKDS